MIKTDFRHTHNLENVSNPFFALPTVLYGLNFGVLGGSVNVFLSINYFGDFKLYFGQIFVLFCLITRGLNAAIITVSIVATVSAFYANDPYLIAIYSIEMLFVHVCMRKGYFLFESAMVYWLLIGIPLILSLHALTSFVSTEFLLINGITRAVNSLICVSIVAICCWFLPSHFIHNKYYSTPPKLSSLIFSLCMLTVTLPAMVISLIFIWQSSFNNEKVVQRALNNSSSQITAFNNMELKRHLNSLQTVTTILENNPHAELQPLIDATGKNYTLFKNVMLTNSYGKVIATSQLEHPHSADILAIPLIQLRKTYNNTRILPEAVITDAIVDLNFHNHPIIGFIAPITLDSVFSGAIVGTMELEQLNRFNKENIDDAYLYVITDSKGRVIARSDSLDMPLLSNFDYSSYHDPLISKVSSLKYMQSVYLYQQSQTKNGWTITILTSAKEITSVLVDYFFYLIVATFIVLTAFAFITKSLSRKITKPLVNIADNFPNPKFHAQIIRESQVSSEMVTLTQKLIDSQEVMTNFTQQLTKQVHGKTKHLKQLNKELYSIAQKDSLTQLLNRAGFNRLAMTSYRNCVRNSINMSLIFIDIDHFKMINDTHGHPFGDKCIVAVAKTIQKHCKRDTDILGRYGGEEFIIMIAGGEINEHSDRVLLIKDEIEKLSLYHGNNTIKMTISAGISSIGNDFSTEYEELLQLSDNQLYISKREGRNRISTIVR